MKFDQDATFGFEIEFKNRWVSPYPWQSKDVKTLSNVPLEGWTAGIDGGRMNSGIPGRVLEYESAVYNGKEWNEGKVDSEVSKAFKESEPSAKMLRVANDLENREGKELTSYEDSERKEAEENLAANRKQIKEDHKEEAQATLQITTLGKRTDEHKKALFDVIGEIDQKNLEIAKKRSFPEEILDLIVGAKKEADDTIAELTQSATIATPEDRLVMDDLAAVTSVLVRTVVIAEGGRGGFGTIKNLVDPLPRRIIAPPDDGFKKRLKIKDAVYFKYLEDFKKRVSKLGETRGWQEIPDQLFTLAWFAKGAMGYKETLATTSELKDTGTETGETETSETEPIAWELATVLKYLTTKAAARDKEKDTKFGPSLWHDIANSNPTLESEIIVKAGKENPEKWTSHEVRNFFFAQGMGLEDMKEYLEVFKKHV